MPLPDPLLQVVLVVDKYVCQAELSLFPNDQYSGLFSHVFSVQNSETCMAAQSTYDFYLPMQILGD